MEPEMEKTTGEYNAAMQEVFYVEELESRLEMAIGPNVACWEINF